MSDERRVAFKTIVVEKDCKRTDTPYWQFNPSDNLTYKLELVKEHKGDKLTEEELFKHGFNGGRSLQHPRKNNIELLSYIDSVFEEDYN